MSYVIWWGNRPNVLVRVFIFHTTYYTHFTFHIAYYTWISHHRLRIHVVLHVTYTFHITCYIYISWAICDKHLQITYTFADEITARWGNGPHVFVLYLLSCMYVCVLYVIIAIVYRRMSLSCISCLECIWIYLYVCLCVYMYIYVVYRAYICRVCRV